MRVVEDDTNRLALKSSGRVNATTCILDKPEGVVRVHRQVLLWRRSPLEAPLADIEDVTISEIKDAASGSRLHIPVLRLSSGQLVSLSSTDEDNAGDVVEKIRSFLDIDADRRGPAGPPAE